MIYIIKQKGLYQNKENSSLVSTCNCKAIGVFFSFFLLKISRNNNNNFINLLKKAFQLNLQCQISKT